LKAVGVLVSGRGSNLQALIEAARAGSLGGTLAVVLSNLESAPALERARSAGIPALAVSNRGRPREEHEKEVLEALAPYRLDLLCLAGYMRLLSPFFIRSFAGPILNIHPSLLPAFPGVDAQRQAWEYGVKVSGATVHFVDEALDAGPIVLQEPVALREDDTLETLAGRILEAEHRLYPRAVRLVLERRWRLEGRRARLEGPA
jgi:phosphoribosylglycinamide formyltransferase 1